MGPDTANGLSSGQRLLLIIGILTCLAVVARPLILAQFVPPQWTGTTSMSQYHWLNLITAIVGVAILVALLWQGNGWARWLLIIGLLLAGLSAFSLARRAGPTSPFTLMETARGVMFLGLALALGRSRSLRDYLREAGPPQRDWLVTTGAVLSWIWLFVYSRFAIQTLIDFVLEKQSAVLIMVPTGRYVALSTAALVAALISALTFTFRLPRLRVFCILAPLLSLPISLVTPLMGAVALYFCLALLAIGGFSWRRLNAPRD